MNVSTLCLSILYENEASGYDIRKSCTEGECSYFVEASYGSIYPALNRLERDGLVTSRIEPQQGKPARKVYAITEDGRRHFENTLFEPLDKDMFRSPFLLFALFADIMPRSLIEKRIQQCIETHEATIARLRDLQKERGSRAADAWVLNFGLHTLGAVRTHLLESKDELIALGQAEPIARDAAE